MEFEFLKFPDKDLELAKKYRVEVIKKLKGDLFTAEAWDKLNKTLKRIYIESNSEGHNELIEVKFVGFGYLCFGMLSIAAVT